MTDPAEKRACVEEALGGLTCTANLCRQADIPVEIVSCGGTGTYWVGAAIPGVTELQAGGGIFHDVHYADYFGVGHQFAMTVMTTVISRPTPTRIVVDAGRKTMSSEEANPRPLGVGEVESLSFSAEQSRIELARPNTDLKVGDKVEWIVGNSDTTVLLHDKLYVTRDEKVEVVWPILGRDKLR